MEKPSDIDETSEVTNSGGSADLKTTEYIQNARWQEMERAERAIRRVELPVLTHPLTGFRFFGIVGTWMEEDIISASVSNAFHQGCEKVFLVDNCSSDQTVENAVSSGATLAHSYRTKSYDERLRIELMNTIMREVTEQEKAVYSWWLWFDADEFPHGPEGSPLKPYLASLDARYRVVGAQYFHHFPSSPPHYIPPYHPIHFQPLCYEQHFMGGCGHRKHPLIRIDRDRPPVVMQEGFHRCDSSEVLLEPSSSAFIHHFPFRAPESTLRRMTALCGLDGANTSRIQRQDSYEIACYGEPSHSSRRFALFESVYSGNWDLVAQEIPGRNCHAVNLQAWTDEFSGWEVDVWYSKAELFEATQLRQTR